MATITRLSALHITGWMLAMSACSAQEPSAAGDNAAGGQSSAGATSTAGTASGAGATASAGRGGVEETDASRVGDGVPSTAAQRGALKYGGPDGCSERTDVLLEAEPGGTAQRVCGVAEADSAGGGVTKYLGIPYAAPPTDARRWAEPSAPEQSEVRAVEYGPSCPQGDSAEYDPAQQSEDCLYLNVWAPSTAVNSPEKLPVLVFIHGGAFIRGSAGMAALDTEGKLNLYDGKQFLATARASKRDAIFVSMNYRLGALGFLAGDKLGVDGNLGIKDQTKALEWVQRNIARFGGDPNRVMIFGESAGAQSVALHTTITAGGHQKLFGAAALQSNYAMSYMSLSQAQTKADAFAKAAQCDSAGDKLSCLRGKSVADILTAQAPQNGGFSAANVACVGMQAFLPWNPVLDGKFVTANPISQPITKPVLLGSNLSEGPTFVAPLSDEQANGVYRPLMTYFGGVKFAQQVDAAYSAAYPKSQNRQKLEQVLSDYQFTCFNRAFARKASLAGAPVYRYFDAQPVSFSVYGDQSAVGKVCSASSTVCHGDELALVFGNPSSAGVAKQFTTAEASLSSALQQYWLQFASGGTPNGAAPLVEWKESVAGSEQYLHFAAPASALTMQDAVKVDGPAFCDFWDELGYELTSNHAVCAP